MRAEFFSEFEIAMRAKIMIKHKNSGAFLYQHNIQIFKRIYAGKTFAFFGSRFVNVIYFCSH